MNEPSVIGEQLERDAWDEPTLRCGSSFFEKQLERCRERNKLLMQEVERLSVENDELRIEVSRLLTILKSQNHSLDYKIQRGVETDKNSIGDHSEHKGDQVEHLALEHLEDRDGFSKQIERHVTGIESQRTMGNGNEVISPTSKDFGINMICDPVREASDHLRILCAINRCHRRVERIRQTIQDSGVLTQQFVLRPPPLLLRHLAKHDEVIPIVERRAAMGVELTDKASSESSLDFDLGEALAAAQVEHVKSLDLQRTIDKLQAENESLRLLHFEHERFRSQHSGEY